MAEAGNGSAHTPLTPEWTPAPRASHYPWQGDRPAPSVPSKGYTFCTLIVKVKLSVTLLCVYVCIAWKGHYCVERDVKP